MLTAALLAIAVLLGAAGPAVAEGDDGATDTTATFREIVFPILGWDGPVPDNYGVCRGSGCSRRHEGIDMMADHLTPLVAARDAVVRRTKTTATPDGSQGNYVFLEDADGWEYRYIHVNNDSPGTDDGANPEEWVLGPGIEEGVAVVAGQVVGYAGDSGNAEWAGHHLHFEIRRPDGTPIDPYASLVAAPRLDEATAGGATTAEADPEAEAFVAALHHDFLGRAPTDVEAVRRLSQLRSGMDRGAVIRDFVEDDAWVEALVDGYYRATLGRGPDAQGRRYWIDVLVGGRSAADVAADFFASDEYHARVGGTDDAWIDDLARQLLGRPATSDEIAGWTSHLRRGATRNEVAFRHYQSTEHRTTRVTALYDDLLGRAPDPSGLRYWVEVLGTGQDLDLATYLATSQEYWNRAHQRFGPGAG